MVGHQPGSITRISVAVLTSLLLLDADLLDADCADILKVRGATGTIRSRTPRTEINLNIFGIVYSTPITSTAVKNSSYSFRKSTVLVGGRVRLERRRRDASSDPLALRDGVDEIDGRIARSAIYEELAGLLWLHYADWEDGQPTSPNFRLRLPCF